MRQVVIEVYQRGDRRTVDTHVRVLPSDFSNGRVQPSCPDHDLLNRRIRRIMRRLMEVEDEMADGGISPTPSRITEACRHGQTRSATIGEWIDAVIGPSTRRRNTMGTYRTIRNSLEAFHPSLRLAELSHDLIMRWQHWMRTERHLSENTIALRLKALRCLVSEAVKRDVIRADNDPFRRIRIPEIQARREHLTEDELAAIEQVTLHDLETVAAAATPSVTAARLLHIRDAFLFCCYTGLRWGDFRRLTATCLVAHTLVLRQHKTGAPLRIPLDVIFGGKALDILGRHPSIEALANIGDNRRSNADLRLVGKAATVGKYLHWHLARHTCGTLLNRRGLRMQEIQFLLGHQRQATTERHYAETSLDQVHDSLRKAFT